MGSVTPLFYRPASGRITILTELSQSYSSNTFMSWVEKPEVRMMFRDWSPYIRLWLPSFWMIFLFPFSRVLFYHEVRRSTFLLTADKYLLNYTASRPGRQHGREHSGLQISGAKSSNVVARNITRQENTGTHPTSGMDTTVRNRSALFWATTQRAVVILYHRFWTTKRFHLQGSYIQSRRKTQNHASYSRQLFKVFPTFTASTKTDIPAVTCNPIKWYS